MECIESSAAAVTVEHHLWTDLILMKFTDPDEVYVSAL